MDIYAHTREAVRVKVKKCEHNLPLEWRKFSVDPQITSLEVLYSLLAKAFDIKSDFSIKYKAFDPAGNEIYLAVLSDWDLDAAFLRIHNLSIQTSTEPCLMLQIDIKPFTEVKEWDAETPTMPVAAVGVGGIVSGNSSSLVMSPNYSATSSSAAGGGTRELMSPLQQSFGVSQKYVQHMHTKLPGLIMNQVEKTFSIVQKAFNLSDETMATLPPRAPLSDNEFRLFLDALGQIQRSDELRKMIFLGGIDPSLRRVVWKHILNVYPSNMNGRQRMDYMRRKSEHYYKLRDTWKSAIKQGCVVGELSYVTSMVKKDVLRTDRLHPFYAGSDDNQNIASLFNILTTYALNHPSVSYCQGMSDIASPLLVTMNDEAQAYICFCAIMSRVRGNFMLDGIAMTQKFAHLTEALSFYDPEFWDYLKSQQADDLLFCYRWLLLELKREFPFEDALRMLEVQWTSLKYNTNVDKELSLYEKEFVPMLETSAPTTSSSLSGSMGSAAPLSPSYLVAKQRENPYTKVCALRRQSSSVSLSSLSSSLGTSNIALNTFSKLDNTKRLNHSLDDNMTRHAARRKRHASAKAHQSLDETKMLMLMEGIESKDVDVSIGNESTTELDIAENIDYNDDDDDVFATEHTHTQIHTDSIAISSNNDANQFYFHPTNPFIEDAQCNAKVLSPLLANSNAAFLSNTSSPLSEHNCSENLSELQEDNKIDSNPTNPTQVPKGIAKLQNKNILSNYNAVSNIIAKQLANASSVGDSVKRVGSGSGGHFKDLKEKLAATGRRGMSFDEPANVNSEKSQQKLVKNFNEFLNFAALNKNRIADRFATQNSKVHEKDNTSSTTPSPTHAQTQIVNTSNNTTQTHPLVQLTKSGFVSSLDDSDSSSVPETTWSVSTAATAIQQTQNLSNNSLHLELQQTFAELVGETAKHTPETPGTSSLNDKQRQLPNDSSLTPDDSQDQEYYPMTTAITRELRLDADNLDRQVFGDLCAGSGDAVTNKVTDIGYEKLDKDSLDLVDDLKENEIITCPDLSELLVRRRQRNAKIKSTLEPLQHVAEFDAAWEQQPEPGEVLNANDISTTTDGNLNADFAVLKLNPFIASGSSLAHFEATSMPHSNSLPEVLVPIFTEIPQKSPAIEMATSATDEIAFATTKSPQRHGAVNGDYSAPGIAVSKTTSSSPLPASPMLPPPAEFGGGNPFLMFLCLTLLVQHRNTIMKSGMDYNEIAMHFDKMVRKHDVTRVLNQARRMYIEYLKVQNAYQQQQNLLATTDSDINKNSTSYASDTVAKS